MTSILFYLFSAILLFAGFRVITAKNAVHASMFLILAFFTTAALWLLLEAEFLAITLVLVYVGAVMVLFLFVVMMLDVNLEPLREGFTRYFPAGALVAATIVAEMAMVLGGRYFSSENFPAPVPHGADYSNTKELGEQLYTVHVFSFEVAAAILLIAIVAAIGLTFRQRPSSKKQNIPDQHRVSREDRIRLLDIREGGEA
ncbi:MAG: NADH-quinone oxidoreductase subunit J [Gammaproteobacteria bacterium]|jgi:NADH-quinone oxidoreductase subunit J|nr:NADH-quinone oxidoreductase subunit J [Gammaproteobacteria bacterium]MBT4608385.1 NADH-quinone oxidoreductase subunit J [Thiotrichales bacterium]MBT3472258.1 NADH-quinone oxidoreductase subunit J [Gammaproteobacteria bacterium]MBT3968089.1 NADH-quinone oxidoreductase subunit J [Gammaproteobacteria bacterium]MBT4079637.1 NADH-quinone oxidoreductase subunit J [Gammaproteobacteria bacterium]